MEGSADYKAAGGKFSVDRRVRRVLYLNCVGGYMTVHLSKLTEIYFLKG